MCEQRAAIGTSLIGICGTKYGGKTRATCPLHRDGAPWPHADPEDGASFGRATRDTKYTYPKLTGHTQHGEFLLLAAETGRTVAPRGADHGAATGDSARPERHAPPTARGKAGILSVAFIKTMAPSTPDNPGMGDVSGAGLGAGDAQEAPEVS